MLCSLQLLQKLSNLTFFFTKGDVMAVAEDLMRTDFIKIDANDTISQFIGAIKKNGVNINYK